ncbi:HAD family hydrolase [Pseudoalteromonas sp. T1lg65]|uniref:HAD family hydrolase n=1 Tax=Pseudoalteromonas sp. T1lg65 TaxID=2077101 RepID=UPI003F79A161
MSIKAVLFDFDGTLVDSETLHYESWKQVLEPYRVHYDEATFCDEFSGVPTLQAAAILNQRHGLQRSAEDLCTEKNDLFVKTAASLKPKLMPFAKDIVELAAQQYRLALVTGSSRAEALPVLEYYGLTDYFQVIVTKDDVENPKPHPEPYLRALSLLELPSQEGIAIEDTSTGLQSAKGAGLRAVAVPNLHSKKQNFTLADICAQDLVGALQWIKEQS